jgi:hypothetical protein
MKSVENIFKNRALLTILAIIMVWGSFTAILAPEAHACSPNTVETTYYTNASKTVECGFRILFCNCGGTFSSGCVTPYRTTDSSSCE